MKINLQLAPLEKKRNTNVFILRFSMSFLALFDKLVQFLFSKLSVSKERKNIWENKFNSEIVFKLLNLIQTRKLAFFKFKITIELASARFQKFLELVYNSMFILFSV